MAIDLPPVMPPVLASKAQAEAAVTGAPSVISTDASGTTLKVYGNRYLTDAEVSNIISAAQTPSEAILQLTRRYYESGHLLVKIRYFRALDSILVFVDQLKVSDVRGDSQAAAHFAGLVGDADLTIAEFDRPRVLADVQAQRSGLDYTISYEEQADNQVAIVFTPQKVPDYDATDLILEANNKGSRFLGRYFGMAGLKHRTDNGTQVALVYQTAFADFGESRDGDELNQYSFSIDHPFTSGLYGVDVSYTEYTRNPQGYEIEPGTGCILGLVCLIPPSLTTKEYDLDAEILQLTLRGEQVLFSTPWKRFTISEKLQHIDSTVEDTDAHEKILEEVYQTAEIGAKFLQTNYDTEEGSASQLSLGVDLKFGYGDGGTLDDYANYKRDYLDQYPTATVPEVAAQARTAEFIALKPTFAYQVRLSPQNILKLNARGQLADEQLPQQQQFVLGGMTSLSAYLPGVLVGDEGYFLDAQLEHHITMGEFKLVPTLFAEYGGAWYQNASSPEGDEQSISDAGISVKLQYGDTLYTEVVAATPISDDVSDEDRLESLEADFYWRVRLTF
jgi:hypothetical protein